MNRKWTRCSKKRLKVMRKTSIGQVVNLLSTINNQLIGINITMNNDLNNLSSVISNDNSNMNANITNAINNISTSLSNRITTSTNTVISNSNSLSQRNCEVRQLGSNANYSVPCGSTVTVLQQHATTPPSRVFITALTDQRSTDPCQAVLIVTLTDGSTIERPLIPRDPPNFVTVFKSIELDNYASIAIRCESSVVPPPTASCTGFVQAIEYVCICCEAT